MPDFLDKVKEKMDKGISLVTSKSKETIETAKLRNRIRHLRQQREEKIEGLGKLVYEMLKEDQWDEKRMKDSYSQVIEIETEIKNLENTIERIKRETEQTVKTTPTSVKAFAYCTCGAGLIETSKFCSDCGANVLEIIARTREELAKQVICDKCGTQLSPSAKFCKKCGSPVSAKAKESSENHSEKQDMPSPGSED